MAQYIEQYKNKTLAQGCYITETGTEKLVQWYEGRFSLEPENIIQRIPITKNEFMDGENYFEGMV